MKPFCIFLLAVTALFLGSLNCAALDCPGGCGRVVVPVSPAIIVSPDVPVVTPVPAVAATVVNAPRRPLLRAVTAPLRLIANGIERRHARRVARRGCCG